MFFFFKKNKQQTQTYGRGPSLGFLIAMEKFCSERRFCMLCAFSGLATICLIGAVIVTPIFRDAEFLNPRLNDATCVTTSHEITERICEEDSGGGGHRNSHTIERLKRGSSEYPCFDGSIVVNANYSSVFIEMFKISIFRANTDRHILDRDYPLQRTFGCFASMNPYTIVLQRPDENGFKIATVALWCLFGIFVIVVILMLFLFNGRHKKKQENFDDYELALQQQKKPIFQSTLE